MQNTCCNKTIRQKYLSNLKTDLGFKNNQAPQRVQPNLGCKNKKTHQRSQIYWRKYINNTVTQEGDEHEFEDNADKINKEDSENKQENIYEDKNKSTWKTRKFFSKVKFHRFI